MNRDEATWHIDIDQSTGQATVNVSPITHDDATDEPCPLKRHAIESEKETKCTLCVESFENLTSFGSHIFNCFTNFSKDSDIQTSQPKPPPLEGPFPRVETSPPSRKLSSESTDSTEGFIKCADCGAKYRSEKTYVQHFDHFKTCKMPEDLVQRAEEIRSESEKIISVDQGEEVYKMTSDPYKCDACKKTFKTQGGLTIHRRYYCKVDKDSNYGGKHINRNFGKNWNNDDITEGSADGSTADKDATNEPVAIPIDQEYLDNIEYLKCRLCGTNCSNQSGLTVHMEKFCPLRSIERDSTSHNHEIFKYKCDLCLQPFPTKPALTTHKRYRCRIQLDPDFVFRKNVPKIRNDGPFKCNKCDRVFGRQSGLTIHEKFCGISRTSNSQLQSCPPSSESKNENGSNNDSSDDCPDLSPNASQEQNLDDDVIDLNALEESSEESVRPEEQIIFESAFHIETDSESEDEDDANASRPSSGYGTESSSHGKASPTSDEDMFHISNDDFTLPEEEKSPPSKRPILDDILDEIADHHEILSSKSDDPPATKKPRLSSATTLDSSEIGQSIPKNRVCAFCGLVGKTPAQIRRHEAQVHLNPNKYRNQRYNNVQRNDESQNQTDFSKERIIHSFALRRFGFRSNPKPEVDLKHFDRV